MKRRGASLATVLSVCSIAVLLMLAVASVGVFNLHVSSGLDQREHARNLAESAIHRAIAELVEHEDFGKDHLAGDQFTVTGVDYPGKAEGKITFAVGGPHHSTNNLAGVGSVPGDGRAVPAHMCQLVAQGRCGDVKVWVECFYLKPPFPRGIAATGKIDLTSVSLVGLQAGADYTGDWSTVQESDELPAHLFSNSNADDAMKLGAGCVISGGAGACGGINVTAGAKVAGEIRPHASRQEIPRIEVDQLINRVETSLGSTTTLVEPVVDYTLLTGTQNVGHDLVLDGGVLAVKGDLNVSGTVRGRGAVIVSGSANITGGSDLVAGRQCAVVAGQDLTLVSPDRDTFFFQGMLYAGHRVRAEGVTIFGTVVSHEQNGNNAGDVKLDNVRVVTTPLAVQARMGIPDANTIMKNGGSVPDDSFMMRFYSEPDPAAAGKFLFYGKFVYRCNPIDSNGLPGDGKGGWNVTWSPGPPAHSDWVLWPALQYQLLRQMPDTPAAYSGQRADLDGDLHTILNCDTTNDDYYPLLIGQINTYLNTLEGTIPSDKILDFNLNKLMAPGEVSRILWMREL